MNRNIVLVTVDSLRADHCSFAGYDRETTPALDQMAAEGFVFANAVAPGPTTPESMPAILTGKYPADRVTDPSRLTTKQKRIHDHVRARDTLAERLSRMGYATGAFTPNPWTSQFFGFEDGFDRFEDFMGSDLSSPIWERILDCGGSKSLAAARLVLSWVQRENVFKPWEAFIDNALDWAARARSPYFLWVFLLDVHFPYLPSPTYRTQSRWREYEANLRLYLEDQHMPYPPRVHEQLRTAYDDSIRYTDAFFSRLRTELADDDPIVIVHGDHGEAFCEHGTYTHQNVLYEENVRVPLVVAGGPSGRVERPVSLRVLPELVTELAATGTVSDAVEPDAYVTARTPDGRMTAIQGGRAKYIRSASETELYDLTRGEHAPVTNRELEAVCERLAGQVDTGEREERLLAAAAEEVARDR